jgi:hypothetical protein
MLRTILHPRTLQPLQPIGHRKDGRAIWPILGGSEPPAPAPAPTPTPTPTPPPAPAAPPPPEPPKASDKGFPEATPLAEMTGEQREAYWRHYARHHEARADARADYDAIKAKAEQFDELQRQQQTPSEQAVNEAKEAGKREGAREAYSTSAATLLAASLTARGKTAEQAQAIIRDINLSGFITDTGIDAVKVESFVSSIATPVKGGGPRPDPSQGPRGGSPTTSVTAGRDLFADRHKPRLPAGTTA